MKTLSATDVIIAQADRAGFLYITERTGRFGKYWTINDDFGLIEVANTRDEAVERVNAVLDRLDPYKLEAHLT